MPLKLVTKIYTLYYSTKPQQILRLEKGGYKSGIRSTRLVSTRPRIILLAK